MVGGEAPRWKGSKGGTWPGDEERGVEVGGLSWIELKAWVEKGQRG